MHTRSARVITRHTYPFILPLGGTEVSTSDVRGVLRPPVQDLDELSRDVPIRLLTINTSELVAFC